MAFRARQHGSEVLDFCSNAALGVTTMCISVNCSVCMYESFWQDRRQVVEAPSLLATSERF